MRTKRLRQKYFINKNSHLSIQCLVCKKSRIFPIETLREQQHTIKVRCPCENTFTIDIEFRKHFREKVNLAGRYRKTTAPGEDSKDCTIVDLSMGGILIKIFDDDTIAEHDELIVNFSLNDKMHPAVERKIKVRHVDSKEKIGGEFIESESNASDSAR